ncbi:Ppx/GppA phosphatase [Candidatus Koribacter versatilis Ellin345]|uniref:Exopolyphosphatase n=1 Tax=Koribacter versatilis (strain Ellin345) TaxID=204669 RepID=Q1ISW4_KORVE|nr:exopolyphosphatase [Candidatus Koribacter versatilis]ABF40036.1 Ppx/GppA phosphatase [Candidatus Koribacter versatilis Ellin345]
MPTFAAVDIGSNSVRLKIAALNRRRLETLFEDREVTRLGESVFRAGLLDPRAMEQTVKVLRRFHRAVQQHGADRVRVVATSALRDARNGNAFLQWVRASTGWQCEVISGLEEGRLIHLGVMAGSRIKSSPMLLIDLGGGSCELTISVKEQIEKIVSLPLGAVRLTKQFLEHDPPKKKELKELRAFIAEEIGRVAKQMLQAKVKMTVATSGTPAALSDMWAARERKHTTTVPRAGLLELTHELSRMTLAQRRTVQGVGTRRAEIIIAGAVVFSELLTHLKLGSFRYLPLGLRDGMLAQMAAEHDQRADLRTRLVAEREKSVYDLGTHFGVDHRHAERVRDHAVRLFQALKPVHGLPSQYEQWVAAASMLAEVGSFINRSGRHRHTYYVISNSEIFGYTVQQRRVIAAIARFVGGSKPTLQSRQLRVLSPQDRPLIPRAVLLLRMARALEQGRRGAVKGIKARVEADRVLLAVDERSTGAELEIWALRKERAYFREVFGRDLLCAEP